MNEYQKVVRGRGSLNRLPELMKKLGISKPMIVGMEPLTGTLLKKNPVLLASPVFSSFHPNPDLSDTEDGADMYLREHCDGLVSIGGGSSIDTAKAIKIPMIITGDCPVMTLTISTTKVATAPTRELSIKKRSRTL